VKIVKRIALAIGALLLLALAILYGSTEWAIRRSHDVPLADIAVPTDAASVAEGGRLAFVYGCRGCHSADGHGAVWTDPPWFVATIAPPGIARKIAPYSNAELLRLIRHGVRRDGTTLYVMPTPGHRFIADDDAGKIIAWLRTLKAGPKDVTQDMTFGPLGRVAMLTGGVQPSAEIGSFAQAKRPADAGKYFYDSACSECHKLDVPNLTDAGPTAPALAPMAASYSLPQFTHLMRTGEPIGGRKLDLMKDMALENFHVFTDAEIAQIHAYLSAEAAKQGAK
jgi:mono/diheme cytochrome c family protein